MKNLLFLSAILLGLNSCTLNHVSVSYENSNASLVNESIKKLNTLDSLKSMIDINDKLVIVGMEDFSTKDYSLLATIEDEMIKQFISNGYRVLERDADMIYRLIAESSEHFKVVKNVKSFDRASGVSINASTIYGGSNSSLVGGSDGVSAEKSYSQKNYDQEFQSNLETADKIISYRVIESGIIYNGLHDGDYDKVKREARTILEVRLTNAKTSEIIATATLDGQSFDFINESHIESLEDFSYKFFSHTLPKTHGIPSDSTVYDDVNSSPKLIAIIGAGVLGLILIITSR